MERFYSKFFAFQSFRASYKSQGLGPLIAASLSFYDGYK
jgi:hypothetical protein